MKILIFGGFGFIGKNLIEELTNEYEIIVIDKNIDEDFARRISNIKSYKFDFSSQKELEKIISKEKPEYIINLISYVTSERELNLFPKMIEDNLNIFLKIYEASKKLESLKIMLQFGSGEEYGNISAPFKEENKEEPSSPYAVAKQITTNTALMLNRNFNYPVCVIRPSNLFGKYQNENKFIPYILKRLKNNEEILTTPGEQKRDFIYVKDFSILIKELLKNSDKIKGEVINVGSGISISLKEIILYLKEKLNSSSEIKFGAIPYRENEMMNFSLDISKLENILNNKLNLEWKDKIN